MCVCDLCVYECVGGRRLHVNVLSCVCKCFKHTEAPRPAGQKRSSLIVFDFPGELKGIIPLNHKDEQKHERRTRAPDKILITAFCILHNLSVTPFFFFFSSKMATNFTKTRLLKKNTAPLQAATVLHSAWSGVPLQDK